MNKHAITVRQQAILDCVVELAEAGEPPPTSGEIAVRLGMPNSSTVREQLQRLRRKGAVDWSEGRRRTLRVLPRETKAIAASSGRPSSAIDLGPGPQPNDRERVMALRVVQEHQRAGGRTPALLTTIAKVLATYRIELRRGKEAP